MDAAALYTVRPSPGEGLGCFATTPIPAGTLILRSTPLFSVAEPRTNTAVTSAFTQLPIPQKAQYLSLFAQNPHAHDTALDAHVIDIFNANAWQTGSRTAICPRAARFNHACIPNASFAWNTRWDQVTIYAIVAIAAGEQIKLSYERPYQTTSSRRAKLAAYGFTCCCPACASTTSDSDSDSDIRRARMVVLDARIRTGRRQLWRSPVPSAALELIRLLKKEGLVGEALGLAYHDAAVGWERHGRLDLAVACARKELDTAVMCFGADSPAVEASTAFLVGLKGEAGKMGGLLATAGVTEVLDGDDG